MKWLSDRTIFKFVSGSHAYGLSTPESDEDIRGVAIPPKEYFIGMQRFEQAQLPPDIVIYNIEKFFRLAIDCNPNIIEFLFVADNSVIKTTPYWEKIKHKRYLFLSKKAKFTFSGYAISQLKKIRVHKKWLIEPPKKKPERVDYGLNIDRAILNNTEMGVFEKLVFEENYNFPKEIMTVFTREKQYQADKHRWDCYQNWLKTRNPKRMALEKKHGYDTKHGMHLIRLLRMGKEILTEGAVNVYREDREELLAIRNGAWSYDKIVKYAEEIENELDELYKTSNVLPGKPNRKELEKLYVSVVEEYLTNEKT